MDENEHMRVGVNRRTAPAKKTAKTDSRVLYLITMGLVVVGLFAAVYVVETKSVLTLLSAPVLGDPK